MDTSSKGKRLLTREGRRESASATPATPTQLLSLEGVRPCLMEGLPSCCTDPTVSLRWPEGGTGWGGSHTQQGTCVPSQQGFYPPCRASSPSAVPCRAQLQDGWLTMGIAGTKEHSGTCQGAKGSDCWGSSSLVSSPSGGLFQAHAGASQPARELYNSAREPPLCSAWWVLGPPIFK